MQNLVHELSKQLARHESKRRRAEDSSESGSTTTAAVQDGEAHSALLDKHVHERLINSVDHVIAQSHDRRLTAGRAFISRMCYAVFMAVQAAKPLEYGVEWGALLYIAYYLVTNSYDNGPYDLSHPEGLSVERMRSVIVSLGMAPICSPVEEEMMKMFRTLSRAADEELAGPMMRVWHKITGDSKVSLAVEGLMVPCARAYTLFCR